MHILYMLRKTESPGMVINCHWLLLNITSLKIILLTHWGWVTHICISETIIIGSDNAWCQTIIWTSAGILLIKPLGINISEILIAMNTFSFKKVHLKMSSWFLMVPWDPEAMNQSTGNGSHHWFFYSLEILRCIPRTQVVSSWWVPFEC